MNNHAQKTNFVPCVTIAGKQNIREARPDMCSLIQSDKGLSQASHPTCPVCHGSGKISTDRQGYAYAQARFRLALKIAGDVVRAPDGELHNMRHRPESEHISNGFELVLSEYERRSRAAEDHVRHVERRPALSSSFGRALEKAHDTHSRRESRLGWAWRGRDARYHSRRRGVYKGEGR